MRLTGRIALVTGAAGGIGRAIANLFAREGAQVVATDVDEDGLEETCRDTTNTVMRRMDVGEAVNVKDGFASVREEMGGLDILVCAAGIVGSKFGDGPAGECTEEAWDQVMKINLKGVWLCCRYALPLMLDRGSGSLITISSATALQPPAEFFKSHAYMTSKGGVVTLTKSIAAYYGKQGIRANVIAPGMIDTPMSERMQGMPDVMAYLKDRQPLGALGMPADPANAALFLASDESRFITGTVLPVDGGWSGHG
jgi:NAD(P)-dependent dehydrogenase (short-subunit alcohol dehydrogenase family)